MAKIVKLVNQASQIVYPATITSAIVDFQGSGSQQTMTSLSTVLRGLETKIGGISLVRDNDLQYHLEDSEGNQLGDSINIAQETFLDRVELITNYNDGGEGTTYAIHFIFNTGSNKTDIYIPLRNLVDVYSADGTTIEKSEGNVFSVKSGVFASSTQGTRADNALQSISKGTDGSFVTTSIGTKTGSVGAKTQTIATSIQTQQISSADNEHQGLAEASDVKNYVDSQVGNKNVTAESSTPNQITASAANNKVTVGAVVGSASADSTTGQVSVSNADANSLLTATTIVDSINTAVTTKVNNAINGLDSSASSTNDNITVGVTETNGKITSVSVNETYATVTAGNGTGSEATLAVETTNNGGLVKGTDITKVINYVDEKISGANDELDDLWDQVDENTGAIEVINGDANTSGSIAKALKDAKDYADEIKPTVSQGKGINVSTSGKDYNIAANLTLTYNAASGGNGATITLSDSRGNSFGTINVSDIVGNGVLKSSSYSKTTGQLTLTFSSASGVDNVVTVDLSALLDINDVAIASGSQSYLEVTLATTPSGDNETSQQAVFGVKLVNPSEATSSSTGLADAYQVKSYVDSQVGNKNVTAESTTTSQITASAANNKVTVAAVTTTVTGTTSTLSAGNTTGLLTGQAVSNIKTYVDGKIESSINELDSTKSGSGDNVSVEVVETDGKLVSVGVNETYATVTAGNGTGSEATLTVETTNNGGLIKGTDITKVINYVDQKISATSSDITTEIQKLDSSVTSTGSSNITVSITEVDGKLTAATVSDLYATVTESGNTPTATLTVTDPTKLATGSHISSVKSYIDAKVANAIYFSELSQTEYADITSFFSN